MNKVKIALFALAGANLKSELMSQELSTSEISVQLSKGLKDLKKLISFYVFDKTASYRIEIGDEGFNFVGNKFAGSLSQVLNMVAASKMHEVGRGAELANIVVLAEQMEESITVEPALLGKLSLAEKILDGNRIAFKDLSNQFQIEFKDEESEKQIDAEVTEA